MSVYCYYKAAGVFKIVLGTSLFLSWIDVFFTGFYASSELSSLEDSYTYYLGYALTGAFFTGYSSELSSSDDSTFFTGAFAIGLAG